MKDLNLENYNIDKVIKESEDYVVAKARNKRGNKKVFIKFGLNHEGEKMIMREYVNQKFLFEKSKSEKNFGFIFLEPVIDGKVLVYPDIEETVEWVGKSDSFSPKSEFKIAKPAVYFDSFIKFEKVMQGIKWDELPESVRNDWSERKLKMNNHFSDNIEYALKNGFFDKTISNKLVEVFEKYFDNWSYQHHDVVPWHIGNLGDGRLILIDSGWAGWSLKYYDFAYYALQMIGYANKPQDAAAFFNAIEEDFKKEVNFKGILMASIVYRGMKLIKELTEEHNAPNSAFSVARFMLEKLEECEI